MELKQFVKDLENILENTDNPEIIEVKMADGILIVKPVLKNNKVFITDVEE